MSNGENQHMPFGQPDGTRVNINVDYGFIVFADSSEWGALASRPEDLRARLLVGRKGSGKTIYLRRMAAYTSGRDDFYSTPIDNDPIDSELVIKFSSYFEDDTIVGRWRAVWRIAVLKSIASHIAFSDLLADKTGENRRKKIREVLTKTPGNNVHTQLSIFRCLALLLSECTSRSQAKRLLDDSIWIELDAVLKTAVTELPPLCFYVDAIDEEFTTAPRHWLLCQLGLFDQVMRFLRDPTWGAKLHLVVCLRDLVLSQIMSGEHSTRYMEDEYIRPMLWNMDSAAFFLERKLVAVSRKLYISPTGDGNRVERWLGISQIHNEKRGIKEPITQYLLRHTRLLPRDLITLGNALCTAIQQGRLQREDNEREATLRHWVSRSAHGFGREQLAITARHISADQMPAEALDRGFSQHYLENRGINQLDIEKQLVKLIKSIGKDRFSSRVLKARSKGSTAEFSGVNPFEALWLNGLLGCVTKNGSESKVGFCTAHVGLKDFSVPETPEYVFHPSLIDYTHIQSIGTQPVIPDFDF